MTVAIVLCALLCSEALPFAAAFSSPASAILHGGRGAHAGPGALGRRLQRPGMAGKAPGLRMQVQWSDEPERLPFQKQWESFSTYNLGRWKGKALHLDPVTGEYIEPFLVNTMVDVMPMDVGVQSAKQRVSLGGTDDGAPQMTETVITVNDEFQSSDDGSYSYDRSLVQVASLPEATFRFSIEFSLAISSAERVRCLALYDFQSKLSRIILVEEQRVQSTGAQRLIGIKLDAEPEPTTRDPLTLLSCMGEFRGDAVGRRASRIGGGDQRFGSRSDMQWSQNKLRREMQVLDQRNRITRKTTWGAISSPAESVVDMGNGHRLLMLPSSCYVCLPTQLESTPPAAPVTDDDASSAPETSPGPEGPEAVKRALEAAFSAEGQQQGDGELADVESFSAEFGCFVNGGKDVLRTVRIYTNDGKMASTTTMAEKRVGDATGSGLSYDQFES